MNSKDRARAKRRTRIKLTLIYTLMVLSVILLVAGLYLIIQGYRFNRFDGSLRQGGLVQFDSVPSGASIWMDGQRLAVKTQNKLTMSAGGHKISMWKEGYKDWNKQVTVNPGEILWLHYIRLVPERLQVDTPVSFTAVASSAASYDGKKMIVMESAASPVLQLVNLDTDTPRKTALTIPVTAYTAPAEGAQQSFTIMRWAYDNRFVLVKHIYGNKTEWLSVDTENPAQAKNITTLLGVEASVIEYTRDDANTVFLLDAASSVRRANLDHKNLSGPLVQNVQSFSLYDSSTVVYVTKMDETTKKRTAAYLTVGAKKPRTVAEYADDKPVQLRIAKYFNSHYLAVLHGEDLRVLQGDLSASDAASPAPFTTYVTATVGYSVDCFGFSPDDHRFLYAQGQSALTTIDLDNKSMAQLSFASAQGREIEWIDQYHFTATTNGNLTMYDYDGTNARALTDAALNNTSALLQNGKYLYGLKAVKDSVQLARVKMTVD